MTPEGLIMKGRMKLRNDYPFAGDTLIYLQPVNDPSSKTMGVDKNSKLYYNPEFTMKLTFAELLAVLIHEVIHLLLLHPYRMPEAVNKAAQSGMRTPEAEIQYEAYGIAADLKVNFMFHEMKLMRDLPKGTIQPAAEGTWEHTFSFPDGHKATLRVRDIQKKSLERLNREIADWLKKELEQCQPPQLGQLLGAAGTAIGASLPGMSGDHEKWKAVMDAMAEKAAASNWMVRAAGTVRNHQKGNMPASLIRDIGELLDPRIDWRGKLQQFVQPIVAAGYSYRRPRRTSWVLGTILPGQDREGIRILAHVDTSGSMGMKELEQISGELYGILDAYPHVEITLLHSDAGPPKVIDLRSTEKEDLKHLIKFKGGGGTSHRPVVKWVLDHNEEATQALVCFTDGDSDIQHCFNDLVGVVQRMLVITREPNIDKLNPFCDDIVFLPTG